MKRFIGTVILVLALPTIAPAQGVQPTFYGSAGIGLPLKPDNLVPGLDIGASDMYKSAINFGAGVGLQLNPNVEILGRVNYSMFGFDDEGFSDKVNEEFGSLLPVVGWLSLSTQVEGADLTVFEFIADVKLFIPVGGPESTLKPFLLGGAGLAMATLGEWTVSTQATFPGVIDTTFATVGPEISETKLVFNLGAGFDWMASPRWGIFGDIRYAQVAVTGDPIGYLPVRVGVIFRPGD